MTLLAPSPTSISSDEAILAHEVDRLRRKLKVAIWLPQQLDISVAKTDSIKRPGAGSGGTVLKNAQSVLGFNAYFAHEVLRRTLSTVVNDIQLSRSIRAELVNESTGSLALWLLTKEPESDSDQIDWLSRSQIWRHHYNALLEAIGEAERTVDLPQVDGATVDTWNNIPTHALDAIRLPAATTQALAPYGVVLTTVDIATWGKDGKLEVHTVDDKRCYRLRDVVDVWLEREEKRSRIAARKAAEAAKEATKTAKHLVVQSDMVVAA